MKYWTSLSQGWGRTRRCWVRDTGLTLIYFFLILYSLSLILIFFGTVIENQCVLPFVQKLFFVKKSLKRFLSFAVFVLEVFRLLLWCVDCRNVLFICFILDAPPLWLWDQTMQWNIRILIYWKEIYSCWFLQHLLLFVVLFCELSCVCSNTLTDYGYDINFK